MRSCLAVALLLPLLSRGVGAPSTSTTGAGHCSLRPGEPVGYRVLCEAAATNATACRAVNISCGWTPGPPAPAPPRKGTEREELTKWLPIAAMCVVLGGPLLLYPLCFYGQGGVHTQKAHKELTEPFLESDALPVGPPLINAAGGVRGVTIVKQHGEAVPQLPQRRCEPRRLQSSCTPHDPQSPQSVPGRPHSGCRAASSSSSPAAVANLPNC